MAHIKDYDTHRDQIDPILRRYGLALPESIPDSVPAPALEADLDALALTNPVCTTACNVGQQLAEQACNLLGNPIAVQACRIAARFAGDFCRSKC